MPQYSYKCEECDNIFDVIHSMSEEQKECEICGFEGKLERIPAEIFIPGVTRDFNSKAGKLVNDYITKTKDDIKEEKEKLKSRKLWHT